MQDVPEGRTPDFYSYDERPIQSASIKDGFVAIQWPDGLSLRAYSLWLFENRMGDAAIEERTREGKLDPADLPDPQVLVDCHVDLNGDLVIDWAGSPPSRFHSGWLHHIANGEHRAGAKIPEPELWRASELSTPVTFDGPRTLVDDGELFRWLSALCRYGLARLEGLPTDEDVVGRIGRRVGAMRDTNFGLTWQVSVDVEPTSTANTALPLPPHTDLPTRETPPGFQLLHCRVNTCKAGLSTMADGYAVACYLQAHEPLVYDALSTCNWVFFNRSPDHDHRWSGPIIDRGAPGQPMTLRAFHPVRAFPDMAEEDTEMAYSALATFSRVAASDEFQMRYPFRPGDLVGFDNRRILHGRGPIDSAGGQRELRGTYIDHDEVYSRLRVLTRQADPSS